MTDTTRIRTRTRGERRAFLSGWAQAITMAAQSGLVEAAKWVEDVTALELAVDDDKTQIVDRVSWALTLFGPIEDDEERRRQLRLRLIVVFPDVTYPQLRTACDTVRNFPSLNSVEFTQKRGGDLVVHVYGSPVDVPEDADCLFHAKISRSGTYS